MTSTRREPSSLNPRQSLAQLTKLVKAIDQADVDLQDYLLALVESEHWSTLSWAEISNAMGVTRQAVQQRVARLVADGSRRRARNAVVDPNQLTITDVTETDIADLPPAKGRKR